MINIFSFAISIILFTELVIIIALLKPLIEPYHIRDLWLKAQKTSYSYPSRILGGALFGLFLNAFLDISWEKNYHVNILDQVKDMNLVLEFYGSKLSMSYTCLFFVLFLFMLIERILQNLFIIARLLEFELMCRHAILTRDTTSQAQQKVLILTNLYETVNGKRNSETLRVHDNSDKQRHIIHET